MNRTIQALACLAALCAGTISRAADAVDQRVSIQFEPQLAGQPVRCGQRYEGQGAAQSSVVFGDLRMFISAPELIDGDGRGVAIKLEPDGRWQQRDVAVLDFENGQASCRNGTPAMHTTLTGTVPPGRYRGLRFTLGVPAALNHADSTLASAPLNQTAMFWSWQSGYRFMKFELEVQNGDKRTGFPIHIGSSACQAANMRAPATNCLQPNRVAVALEQFDPARDSVLLDLSALIAQTRLDMQTPGTAPGCMAAADDPDCAGVFEALGLRGGGPQHVFGVLRKP
jgi:uncharacterized repeat protein (TIGR04052 family)